MIVFVKDYDDRHFRLPELDALEVIRCKMGEMGMKAKDLEPIIGSKGHVSAILASKHEITLKIAQKLKNYFQHSSGGVSTWRLIDFDVNP